MSPPMVIKTTLGELIVAVTDEVMPFVRDPSNLYIVVSRVLNDVLARCQPCPYTGHRRKHRTHLANPPPTVAAAMRRLIG